MSKYKRAIEQVEMPRACEERIRAALALGKMRAVVSPGRRIVRIGAAAAAAVLLLMGGTLAVRGQFDSLWDWFRSGRGREYTETEVACLTELEEEVGLSQDSGGITVTVESVLTTDSTVDVLLRVEGEGLALKEDGNYGFYNFRYAAQSEESQYFSIFPCGVTVECVGVSVDGEADTAYLVFHYGQEESPSMSLRSGGYVLSLSLEDFYRYGESRGEEKEIYEGLWEFEIPLMEVSGENSILLEDLSLPGWQRIYYTDEWENVVCQVDEIVISANLVQISYEAVEGGAVHFEIQAVLADGTVVDTDIMDGHGSCGHMTQGYRWEQIIDLAALDHLLIGGDAVPLPGEE